MNSFCHEKSCALKCTRFHPLVYRCQAKDKERRERVRAIRIKEAQEEYEARLLRSMERAAAPVKKKTVGLWPWFFVVCECNSTTRSLIHSRTDTPTNALTYC